MILVATPLPANAAAHFYSKSASFNPLSVVAVLYSTLAGLSIACLRPFLHRNLPQVQDIPTTLVGANKVAIVTGYVRCSVPHEWLLNASFKICLSASPKYILEGAGVSKLRCLI